jgi:hypothetical protein
LRDCFAAAVRIQYGKVMARIGKVVVVEDEAGIRVVLRELIDTSRRYCCVGAYDTARAALLEIRSVRPILVLMHIRLGSRAKRHRMRDAMPMGIPFANYHDLATRGKWRDGGART